MSFNQTENSLIDKLIRDKNGRIVIWQSPNLPIIGWFVTLILSYLTVGGLKAGFTSLSTAFLFLWADLEITDGASYFRRFVGFIIITFILIGFFT